VNWRVDIKDIWTAQPADGIVTAMFHSGAVTVRPAGRRV